MFYNKSPNLNPQFNCELCHYTCSKKSDWIKHISTAKHTHRTNVLNNIKPLSTTNHECQLCDYKCIKMSEWNRHLATAKHKIRTNVLKGSKHLRQISQNIPMHNTSENPATNIKHKKHADEIKCDKSQFGNSSIPTYHLSSDKIEINENYDKDENCDKSRKYSCSNCNKTYTARNSLWYHKQRCFVKKNQPSYNEVLDIVNKDLEFQTFLIEQNKQFMEYIMKHNVSNSQQPNITNNKNTQKITNNNIINNNNNNNTFCINVFLNEECKDALNINEFVDTIILGINELEETARLGYAPGISKIFINGLKKLDVCKRPVHCSDLKRSTLYIKNNNEWIKEQDDNINLITAIKQVANKNAKNIFEWQKLYPEYNDYSSKQNDKYHKLICNTMSGSTKEEQINNYDKIIRNIIKEVVIDKN